MYNVTKREQHTLAAAFDDGNEYNVIDIDTLFLNNQEQRRSNESIAEGIHKHGS